MFCRYALSHLVSDNECIGVSECLAQLISVNPVRSVSFTILRSFDVGVLKIG